MSGYNRARGVFGLTETKARSWWRRRAAAPTTMEGFGRVLEAHGILVERSFLECEPRPGAIWTALSGLPSDPRRVAHYRCPPEAAIEPVEL